ncbi:hypothetical protein V6N11_014256 [Hibiscus sabdariffa]|uniref:Uncharacterized protein n=1 Tax=Hibiscus sabdariffa TaxID=183260 RepID=A0ABR1ZKD4_9ROSI
MGKKKEKETNLKPCPFLDCPDWGEHHAHAGTVGVGRAQSLKLGLGKGHTVPHRKSFHFHPPHGARDIALSPNYAKRKATCSLINAREPQGQGGLRTQTLSLLLQQFFMSPPVVFIVPYRLVHGSWISA